VNFKIIYLTKKEERKINLIEGEEHDN